MAFASDELILRGTTEEKLSGTVTSIEASGVIELASPLSTEPLRLKPNTVKRVRFGTENENEPQANMLVELINGDRLPVDVKSFTPENGMPVSSPAIGEIVLPTSTLSSLEMGIPSRRQAFHGPGNPAEWSNTRQNGFDKVSVEGMDWSVNGRLEASRQIAMPQNFVLRFQLKWEPRQQPNIRVYFASPEVNTQTKADRYFLQFGSAGFEIKRERTQSSGFPSLLISARRPEEFNGRQVDVEVHVNRVTKLIELYLDGELEGKGRDPMDAPPEGSGIILSINGMDGATHTIRNLTVHELDNTRVRHRAEDRGDPNKDGLISRDEDRWTGDLREIRRKDTQADFIFKIPQSAEPLEIPLEEVSTVFFRKPTDAANDEPTNFRLQLRGEGSLSVVSCRITDQTITVIHPLLGELNLPKDTILGIEPTDNSPNKGGKSE